MKPETAAKMKYGVWGLICGAVIVMIIGFAWGGWTTFGTSQTRTKEAVLASQAAICVAQFMKRPNHEEKLKALEAVNGWQRALAGIRSTPCSRGHRRTSANSRSSGRRIS